MQPIFQEHNCLTEPELKAHLDGSLSEVDRFRVENHLLDCPLCSDAVEGFSLIHTQAPQKVKTHNPNRRWLRVAAAIILIAACLTSLRFFLQTTDQQLYSAFFESYPNEMDNLLRSTENANETAPISPELLAAFNAYDAKDFEISSNYFTKELTSNSPGVIAQFYGGLAALETGNTSKAKQLLKAASQAGSIYEAEAKWYLALTLLREGERNNAVILLEELAEDPKGRYFDQANTLRSKF